MTDGARNRFLKIVIGSFVASLAWFFMGWWLTNRSANHSWLSSFIEIAFALNTSLAVEKIRTWLIKPFDGYCYARMEKSRVACGGSMDDKTIGMLAEKARDLHSRFLYRLESEMFWMPYLGVAAAIISAMVLLTDCSNEYVKFVPLIVVPVLSFAVGALVEFLSVKNEFSIACDTVEEDVQKARREMFMAGMAQAVPAKAEEGEE